MRIRKEESLNLMTSINLMICIKLMIRVGLPWSAILNKALLNNTSWSTLDSLSEIPTPLKTEKGRKKSW
ncbi:hypothetical protein L1987_54945 [Smallanthus sonchifolius]|uniref:Uncharacterized protein n=1 Tax=Smallanthus sonchifolius TaxID=185202 RepID=A0ACB9E904_9ASTR|nr:hypothetical protein L1987_54945 [Smallanthus sonchifolius]